MTTVLLVNIRHALARLGACIATVTGHLGNAFSYRRCRVVAFGCPVCHQWVKPHHFGVAHNICRDCALLVPLPGRGGRR